MPKSKDSTAVSVTAEGRRVKTFRGGEQTNVPDVDRHFAMSACIWTRMCYESYAAYAYVCMYARVYACMCECAAH